MDTYERNFYIIIGIIVLLMVVAIVVYIFHNNNERRLEAEREEERKQYPKPEEETEVKCKVISDTTPYTLINIITFKESYFQYIFEDDYKRIKISPEINCKKYNYEESDVGKYFDLEENAEPYVTIKTITQEKWKDYFVTKRLKTLHLPANTIIKHVLVGGSETVIEKEKVVNNSDSNNNSLLAGAIGLSTGVALGSILNN
jgi:L-lactate permease